MRDEISAKLDEVIEKLLKKIEDLTPGTTEHTTATEALNKLYKLRIEETAHDRDFTMKCEHDVVEERELAFKQNQACGAVSLRSRSWWSKFLESRCRWVCTRCSWAEASSSKKPVPIPLRRC